MPLSVASVLAPFLLAFPGAVVALKAHDVWDVALEEEDRVHFAEDIVRENTLQDYLVVLNLPGSPDLQNALSNDSSWTCKGCDITIDMRCQGQRNRHAFFHRLTDCLLPTYGLLAKAREVKGQHCILTWSNEHGVSIVPLLGLLADDLNARIIPEDAPCVEGVDYWSAQPKWGLGAQQEYINQWESLPHIAGRVMLDMAANMRSFIADAERHAGHGQQRIPRLILVARRSGERSFTPGTEDALSKMIEKVASSTGTGKHLEWGPLRKTAVNLRTDVYLGEEGVLETMQMFCNAAGVVGYHGAGFANSLFAGHPVCVEEITTYMDTDNVTIWRSNGRLSSMNSNLIWDVFVIEVQWLVQQNKAQEGWDTALDKDHFIKEFQHIALSAAHMRHLEKQLVSCLTKNVFLP